MSANTPCHFMSLFRIPLIEVPMTDFVAPHTISPVMIS